METQTPEEEAWDPVGGLGNNVGPIHTLYPVKGLGSSSPMPNLYPVIADLHLI